MLGSLTRNIQNLTTEDRAISREGGTARHDDSGLVATFSRRESAQLRHKMTESEQAYFGIEK